MKIENASLKFWIVYVIFITSACIWIGPKGLKINTDFLSVFPSSAKGEIRFATEAYEKNFKDEIIVFILAKNKTQAIYSAESFAKKMSSNHVFSSVKVKFTDADQDELNRFIYSKRKLLLSSERIEQIENNQISQIMESALQQLYSPIGVSSQISTDPLNLFKDYFLKSAKQFTLRPDSGYLISNLAEGSAVLLRAKINRKSTNFNSALVGFFEDGKTTFNKEIKFYAFGAPLFTAFGSEKSIEEFNLYGTLSMIAVLVLLIYCFASIIPVIASGLTIVISVVSGLAAVLLIYSSVHILSLLMGISILGVVTDYCTHFFSKGYDETLVNNAQVMKKIKSALGIGFLTNMLTYLCFYFTDLEVLQQLSIFTMVGVFSTYITVLAVFPNFKFRRLKANHLLKAIRVAIPWQKFGVWKSVIVMSIIVVIGVIATSGFKFNDDVRLLQDVHSELKSDETEVLKFTGVPRSTSYFLLQGKDPQSLLEKEEAFVERMNESKIKNLAISNFVPSLERQKSSLQAYQKLEPAVATLFVRLGRSTPERVKILFRETPTFFEIEDILKLSPQFPLGLNWLGEIEGKYYSVINILDSTSLEKLKELEDESVHLVSKVADTSQFLRILREKIMGSFMLVILVLAGFLMYIYGSKKAFLVLFPPFISSAATLVFSMLFFGYLNLFNILAVILIFCLGMDYSVFFSQSREGNIATSIGIFISVLSTIISFGVLGLSKTHAVASFGLTVFVGISLCYLIAPLASDVSDV